MPHPRPGGKQLCTCSRSGMHTACRNRGGKKDCYPNARGPCPPADCCFWSQRCRPRGGGIFVALFLPLLQLKWHVGYLKGQYSPPIIIFLFLFFPFESQKLKARTFKTTAYTEKMRKQPHMPRKGTDSEKTWEDLRLTPSSDPQPWDSLQ